MKLWQKTITKLDPKVEKYTVGTDYIFDKELMVFDIQASKAHIKGLERIGILKKTELNKFLNAFIDLENDLKKGKIEIKIEDEDCHTVIENYLISKLRDIGKKVHTGRSRNDQILVALRLYMKDILQKIKSQSLELCEILLDFAKKHKKVPMPGYTHTQQAMLSSVSHYFCAYLESLLDDIDFLDSVYKHIDKNPLGSAASFGVALPLDRKFTTSELGFEALQINSLYCQNSRGKFESLFLEVLAQIMMTLGKMASDFILFTSREFDFFQIPDGFVTGSSIMPQKRNLDVMEILRSYVNVVVANQFMVKDISKNLISGFHRDLQLIKKPLIESSRIVLDSLEIMQIFIAGIKPKGKNMKDKIKKDIFMVDFANDLVIEKNIPFRDAYKIAYENIDDYKVDLQKNLSSKISLGAPGNLFLQYYEKKIQEFS
ncbi:MAG: argininosuccinate lyase, argininosuccinate lyase [Candidatus Peregrinibacteria bacterium GW2011_GWF2_33_10]|nr:MAG: argininosuccinate lyase, argininosuccinate lyase [Candidatus Peregrinibacteria bacterium GW2011_GWF2_33_10]